MSTSLYNRNLGVLKWEVYGLGAEPTGYLYAKTDNYSYTIFNISDGYAIGYDKTSGFYGWVKASALGLEKLPIEQVKQACEVHAATGEWS